MTPAETLARPLGLKEAARVANVSLPTLRRRRDELLKHGATRHADGSWSIPPDTLVALGLLDRVTPTETPGDAPSVTPAETAATPDLAAEVARLREELAAAQHRAALAEAQAAERDRTIEGQALALRALEARREPLNDTESTRRPPGRHPEPENPAHNRAETPNPAKARKAPHWWHPKRWSLGRRLPLGKTSR